MRGKWGEKMANFISHLLKYNHQIIPLQFLLIKIRIKRNEAVRTLHVCIIVQSPVRCPNLPGRVEQSLKYITQQDPWPKGDPHRIDSVHNRPDHMRRSLKAIRPNEIHQMQHRILTPQSSDAKSDMFYDCARSLPVYEIAVGERVF